MMMTTTTMFSLMS